MLPIWGRTEWSERAHICSESTEGDIGVGGKAGEKDLKLGEGSGDEVWEAGTDSWVEGRCQEWGHRGGNDAQVTGEEKGAGKVRGRSVVWHLLLALRFQVDKRNLMDVDKTERRRRRKVVKGARRKSRHFEGPLKGQFIVSDELPRACL